MGKISIEIMGFGIFGNICPMCQKHIPHHGVKQGEAAFKALKAELFQGVLEAVKENPPKEKWGGSDVEVH